VVYDLTAVPQREHCQRGSSQDRNYCTSVHQGIP
jgi:hypothetical protein